jgi:hypothetical protein
MTMPNAKERSQFMKETDEYLRQIVQNDLARIRRPFIADVLTNTKKSSN